jgi:hypothetical protein
MKTTGPTLAQLRAEGWQTYEDVCAELKDLTFEQYCAWWEARGIPLELQRAPDPDKKP